MKQLIFLTLDEGRLTVRLDSIIAFEAIEDNARIFTKAGTFNVIDTHEEVFAKITEAFVLWSHE